MARLTIRFLTIVVLFMILIGILLATSNPLFVNAAISTPTATPRHHEELRVLQGLISDENCTLPCWWGWELGEDNWESIQMRASNLFGTVFADYEDDDYRIAGHLFRIAPSLQIPDEDEYTMASLRLMVNEQDQLTAILLHLQRPFASYLDWNPYMPAGILSTYGVPDEITIEYPTDPLRSSYILNFRYNTLGLFIQYVVLAFSRESDPNLYICNKVWHVIDVHILVQAEHFTLPSLLKQELVWEVMRTRNANNLIEWDIENITTFETLEDFTEFFSQENICFYSLPYDEWVRSE